MSKKPPTDFGQQIASESDLGRRIVEGRMGEPLTDHERINVLTLLIVGAWAAILLLALALVLVAA